MTGLSNSFFPNIIILIPFFLFRIKHVMQWKYLMNWWSLKSVLWLPMSKLWLSSVFRCVTSWMFYLQCVKFMALISFCKGVNENSSCLGAILCLNDLEFRHISLASISFSLSIPCEKFLFGSIFVSYLNSILPCFGVWRCIYENNFETIENGI